MQDAEAEDIWSFYRLIISRPPFLKHVRAQNILEYLIRSEIENSGSRSSASDIWEAVYLDENHYYHTNNPLNRRSRKALWPADDSEGHENRLAAVRVEFGRLRGWLSTYYTEIGRDDRWFFKLRSIDGYSLSIESNQTFRRTPFSPAPVNHPQNAPAVSKGIGSEALTVLISAPAANDSANVPLPVLGQNLIGLAHFAQDARKTILGRDEEATALLDELNKSGQGIISVVAPAGFGKSAIMVRAIQLHLGENLDLSKAGLTGIVVLDAKTTLPGPVSVANLIGEIEGLRQASDKVSAASASNCSIGELNSLFFKLLSRAGKMWVVVENAEFAFSQGTTSELRSLLAGWCAGIHNAKLVLLTRVALLSVPECHVSLPFVEKSLMNGLPIDAAVTLLRLNLKPSFQATDAVLLQSIVTRLHRMPIAIESFAGYLATKELNIKKLDRRFVTTNNILQLFHPGQMQRYFVNIIEEQLLMLSSIALRLLQIVVWAGIGVPKAGLLAIENQAEQADGTVLTQLVNSHLLVLISGRPAEGITFVMHELVREGARDYLERRPPTTIDIQTATALYEAGIQSYEEGLYQPSRTLISLSERCLEETISEKNRDEMELVLVRHLAVRSGSDFRLARFVEAEASFGKAVDIYRRLIDGKGRSDLEQELGFAMVARGMARLSLGRLDGAQSDYDAAILRYVQMLKEGLHMEEELARAFVLRGKLFLLVRKFNEAEADLDEAISIYFHLASGDDEVKSQEELAGAIASRGDCRYYQGRFHEAQADYEQAVDRFRRLVDEKGRGDLRTGLTGTLSSLGAALIDQERFYEADNAYQEAFDAYEVVDVSETHVDLELGLVTVLTSRAQARRRQKRLVEAEDDYGIVISRCLRQIEERGHDPLERSLGYALMNRAEVRTVRNQAEQSEEDYRFAIERQSNLIDIKGREDLSDVLAGILTSRGHVRFRQERFAEAEEDFRMAIIRFLQGMDLGRKDLDGALASVMMDHGIALCILERFEEGEVVFDQAAGRLSELAQGGQHIWDSLLSQAIELRESARLR